MEVMWTVVAAVVCLIMLGVALIGLTCSVLSSRISSEEEERNE